jgi:hypothetical protein
MLQKCSAERERVAGLCPVTLQKCSAERERAAGLCPAC